MPGKLATALTALAALSVSGVLANYDVGAAPASLVGVTLPVLIVQPVAAPGRNRKVGQFALSSPSGSSALATAEITHLLFYSRFIPGRHPGYSPAGLDDVVDNYMTTVRANATLGAALFVATQFGWLIEPVPYGGLLYYGARFFHTLVVEE